MKNEVDHQDIKTPRHQEPIVCITYVAKFAFAED